MGQNARYRKETERWDRGAGRNGTSKVLEWQGAVTVAQSRGHGGDANRGHG